MLDVVRFSATAKHPVESTIALYAVLRSDSDWLYIAYSCWGWWLGELSAAMENASLTADVWNTSSTSDHDHDDHDDHDHDHEAHYHLAHIRVFALKVIYIPRSSTTKGHPHLKIVHI